MRHRNRASTQACAYLADDDHRPLALQEILLAGCPTVGVRTGASFVRDGGTGFVVERLPPGRKCVEADADGACLESYLDAIRRSQEIDRGRVRRHSADAFGTGRIVDFLVAMLESARRPAAGEPAGSGNLDKAAV